MERLENFEEKTVHIVITKNEIEKGEDGFALVFFVGCYMS